MRLEEADLVLSIDAWWVGIRAHNAEVIPDFSGVDCCRSLGDQFYSPHILPIPICSAVECEFRSLLAARIGGVLVIWREVDIRGNYL
jgi:hypothetical protein